MSDSPPITADEWSNVVAEAVCARFKLSPESGLSKSTNLPKGLGADSLDIIQITMSVERRTGIRVTVEDVAEAQTIAELGEVFRRRAEIRGRPSSA